MDGVSDTRLWARRAILSALAGGGLTAIGLGWPLSGGALAAETPSGSGGNPASGSSVGNASSREAPKDATTSTGTNSATGTGSATTSTPTTPAPTTTSTTPVSASPPGVAQPESVVPGNAPTVVAQHGQEVSRGEKSTTTKAPAIAPKPSVASSKIPKNASSTDIAPAPQLAAQALGTMTLLPEPSDAFSRALSFYRIPLFLLPIYQAAAAQYGVPWEILAAINEVETDYGSDLSVSTAGAVGWMQFMPETWLQYGVDALGAGYADPYNPVDAVFAAARYLRAAGAQTDLHAAIFAYNHSAAYVESVLLRARLIASYPAPVIATLTGLTEGSLPVAGARIASGAPSLGGSNSLGATESVSAQAASVGQSAGAAPPPSVAGALPGSLAAPSPKASAARVEAALSSPAPPSQLTSLSAAKNAPVVAVEDGRIVALGDSRRLGNYLVLRDTYGDLFTYAGLGSIAPFYRLSKPAQLNVPKGALDGGEASREPTPTAPATAGRQLPLTLHVAAKLPAGPSPRSTADSTGSSRQPLPVAPVGVGKVRVFAHPGNPDALAAARARAAAARTRALANGWTPLKSGSVVTQGTVLGRLGSSSEASVAYLRFAIRPAGDGSAINPQPILENWRQLDAALHPKGSKAGSVLAGATANDAFQLSAGELERAVLADPGITLSACDRGQVAAGKVDSRSLAVLVFLSRSGLKPTVGRLRCGRSAYTAGGVVSAYYPSDTIDLTAVNGVPIAGHQGQGTITDLTIRTLLTIGHRFAPKQIVSLMSYPNAPSTTAKPDHGEYIEIELGPQPAGSGLTQGARAIAASTVAARRTPIDAGLTTLQWQRLATRIASLPQPRVSRTPSSAAIRSSSGR